MLPFAAPGSPPPSVVPRNLRKLKFLDIDPLELARQLTLFDSRLFKRIQANECLGKAWPKEFASEGSPNIKSMIDMSNAVRRRFLSLQRTAQRHPDHPLGRRDDPAARRSKEAGEHNQAFHRCRRRTSAVSGLLPSPAFSDPVLLQRCRVLNNFSTLMQIIAGLNSTPIHRLRRTWESVPQRHMLTLGQLNDIMSPTKNYAAYREMVRNLTPPCVPFLGAS